MKEKNSELTSALLDGELDRERQVHIVTKMLSGAPEELERFGRYRLIGDVLRGESAVPANKVAAAVRDALRDEPVIFAPATIAASKKKWLRPLAGLAVAASVASVALMVAPQMLDRQRADPATAQVGEEIQPRLIDPLLVASREGPAAAPTGDWETIDQDLAVRLNRLVIEHHEFGGRTGINGPVPHIGLVSYGAR